MLNGRYLKIFLPVLTGLILVASGLSLYATPVSAWQKDGGITCQNVFAKIKNDGWPHSIRPWDGYVKANGATVVNQNGNVSYNNWAQVSWTPTANFQGHVEAYVKIKNSQGQTLDSKTVNGDLDCRQPAVNIDHIDLDCGEGDRTFTGTASFAGATQDHLVVSLDSNVILDDHSEPTNWSAGPVFVALGNHTLNVKIYDNGSGSHHWGVKAEDNWQFEVGECGETEPSPEPSTPPVGGGPSSPEVGGNITTPQCPNDRPQKVDQVWFSDIKPGQVTVHWVNKGDAYGFHVAYGPSPDNLPWGVEVDNVDQTTLTGLPGGDLWVTVAAKSSEDCGGPTSDPFQVSAQPQVLGAAGVASQTLALFAGLGLISLGLWQAQSALKRQPKRA